MPDTNEKVAALDALAEKATDSEWHPTFQAKTEFQNALLNAWRTWLREAALRGLENPKEQEKADGKVERDNNRVPVSAGAEQVRELLDRARKWRDTLRWEGSTDAMYALAKDVVAVLESALPLAPLAAEWVQVPRDLLEELDDYLLDREDVRDGSDGRPLPNDAMSLRTRLECYILQPTAPSAQRGRDE